VTDHLSNKKPARYDIRCGLRLMRRTPILKVVVVRPMVILAGKVRVHPCN
jgi:hypothetical protein